jgi:hypothetical protein
VCVIVSVSVIINLSSRVGFIVNGNVNLRATVNRSMSVRMCLSESEVLL